MIGSLFLHERKKKMRASLSCLHRLCLLALPLWVLGAPTPSLARTPLCEGDTITACSGLETNACLETYHACGFYREIIEHFDSLQAPDPEQMQYYQGVALHGLLLRSRAHSLRCDYLEAAKSNLFHFLSSKRSQFEQQGNFGGTHFLRQIYHASKTLKDLRSMSGCLESGLSKAEARITASHYFGDTLRSILVGTPPAGALGDQILAFRQNIRESIGGFVSTAANIETLLGLRREELKASFRRLDLLVDIYLNRESGPTTDPGLGTVTATRDSQGRLTTVTLELAEDGMLLSAKEQAGLLLAGGITPGVRGAQDYQNDLVLALSGTDIEEYEAERSRIVQEARLAEQAGLEAAETSLFIAEPRGTDTPFWQAVRSAEQARARPSLGATAARLRTAWREQYGVWNGYCRDDDPDSMRWLCAAH